MHRRIAAPFRIALNIRPFGKTYWPQPGGAGVVEIFPDVFVHINRELFRKWLEVSMEIDGDTQVHRVFHAPVDPGVLTQSSRLRMLFVLVVQTDDLVTDQRIYLVGFNECILSHVSPEFAIDQRTTEVLDYLIFWYDLATGAGVV